MSNILNLLLTAPFTNVIIVLYSYIAFQDLGLAIILFTILLRLVLWPVFYRQLKSQSMMQKIQPELQKVQEKHKGKREESAMAIMAVYKRHKVNPFSPFLYLLIQIPIIFAIYKIFGNFSHEAIGQYMYSFVSLPDQLNTTLFGLIDLTKPNMIIVGLTAIAQYIQSKLSLCQQKPGETLSQAQKMGKYMVFLGPVLTIVIFSRWSAALALYWLVTTVVSIFQQRVINKQIYAESTGKN